MVLAVSRSTASSAILASVFLPAYVLLFCSSFSAIAGRIDVRWGYFEGAGDVFAITESLGRVFKVVSLTLGRGIPP